MFVQAISSESSRYFIYLCYYSQFHLYFWKYTPLPWKQMHNTALMHKPGSQQEQQTLTPKILSEELTPITQSQGSQNAHCCMFVQCIFKASAV